MTSILDRAGAPADDLCARHNRLDSLLVRVGEGDRAAFSTLYDELVPTIYGMSLGAGHGPSPAARITLHVFLRAWLQARSFDPEVASAWTWVRAIASTTISEETLDPAARRSRTVP